MLSYASIIQNGDLASAYEAYTSDFGQEFCTDPFEVSKGVGSTDFGNVSFTVPGIHPCYSIMTTAVNHSREFTAASGTLK